jgi:uncharacterized protein (DUF1800 family)
MRLSTQFANQTGQLQGDDRILHALNRFTFGPRLGDLASVQAVGLDRWFDQQLHPASLDDSALQARLTQFPAMQWSSEDLLYRLPSNAVIRQAIDGKLPVPDHGALHAIYENQVYRIAAKKQEKEQKKQQTVLATNHFAAPAMHGGGSGTASAPSTDAEHTRANPFEPVQQSLAQNMMAADNASSEPAIDPLLFTTILALPPQQRLIRLTAMKQPEFDTFFQSLKGPQRLSLTAGMNPNMKETVSALENPERLVVDELTAQRLTRDIYSNAQLQEVMTDFWLNHFNVFLRKNEATPYYLVGYERDVIRPHALGRFEDLLEATAHSPAMLGYLDNSSSIGRDSQAAEKAKAAAARQPANKKNARQGLNENYARELMELHTQASTEGIPRPMLLRLHES